MRKCAKCGQIFDDSWKQCLHCGMELTNDLSVRETNPELKEKRERASFLDIAWPKNKAQAMLAIKGAAVLYFIVIGIRISFMVIGGYYKGILSNLLLAMVVVLFLLFKSRIIAIPLLALSMLGMITNISGMTALSFLLLVSMISATRGTFVFHAKQQS